MPNKIFRKINITKLKKFLKELPEILVKHTFLSFLSFLLLALILGSFSFYQYIALSQEAGVPVSKKVLCLDKEKYQGILEEWQNRQEKFKQASQKHFLDPFQEIRIETIEEPVIEEPVIEEPVIEEPVIEEPVIEEPVIEEPVIEEPVIEEPVIEEPVEEFPLSDLEEKLLKAGTLFEFYILKTGSMLSIDQRAKIWEEKGLGIIKEYNGFPEQNQILLEALKWDINY